SACGPQVDRHGPVTGLEELGLSAVEPRVWLPGTRVLLSGKSFVDADLGEARLRLVGAIDGRSLDVQLPARYMDPSHLHFQVDFDVLGGAEGRFRGDAVLEFDSLIDGRTHAAQPLSADLTLARIIVPRLDRVSGEPLFVNDPVSTTGDGFLLGG